ncbi:MAG: DNA-J related domain-containing protein [Paraglaciecola sp.]|uniref:DNA-J related domain-containing protein n=1 Tax=Paraglaciecola sp. TaxID=1920173 RepID=UPI00329A1D5F
MPYTPSDWAPLQPILQNILLAHETGISEYELFQYLQSPPYELFSKNALQQPLSLFQSHFIVFNALYQLQGTWLREKTGILQISCSCIRRDPWEAGQNGLINQDKLRAYYLDWTNLSATDESQVEALLDSFWAAFSGLPNQTTVNAMTWQQALDILNLKMPFSLLQLKQQYRKMLHQHHPDKGGDNSLTVLLHNAYERLKVK